MPAGPSAGEDLLPAAPWPPSRCVLMASESQSRLPRVPFYRDTNPTGRLTAWTSADPSSKYCHMGGSSSNLHFWGHSQSLQVWVISV